MEGFSVLYGPCLCWAKPVLTAYFYLYNVAELHEVLFITMTLFGTLTNHYCF